jgi:hypothetical protein
MKKIVLLLCIFLLALLMISPVSIAEPSRCENCGQNSVLLMSCGSFNRWKQASAVCSNNYRCTQRTSLYTTVFTCPVCDWSIADGTHEHMTEHTICENELLCPFSDEVSLYRIPPVIR